MAEIETKHKRSTRIDLTPMVDLGFLLITFFVFTTSISRPNVVKLYLPKDSKDSSLRKESAVITLLPSKNDFVYYYEGLNPGKMQTANAKSIRDILLDKKSRTDTAWFTVILKPTPESSYKNIVGLFDEMLIDDIHHYSFVDITPYEYNLIQHLNN